MDSAMRLPAKGLSLEKSASRLLRSGQLRRTHSILFSPDGARFQSLMMLTIVSSKSYL